MEVDEMHAPGRKRMVRRGRVDVYWVADPRAVRAGYSPKTVPLKDDPGDLLAPPEIAARCRVMWQEMKAFLAGQTAPGVRAAPGTIAWLADLYQADKDSPYRRLRASSRPGYDRSLAIVRETVGPRRVDTVTANDVRRWFRSWGRASEDRELANPRRAYGCVQILRIVVKFGKGQRLPGCRDFSEILTDVEFPAPRGRRIVMSAEQATAIIGKAHEIGRPSIALAVALQFGCGLRQKDVIGEWVEGRWSAGLLWGEHVRADWTLAKPTSKTNFREIAEFDLRLILPALAELQLIDPIARVGIVVRDEDTSNGWRQRKFAHVFREIARAAGVPDDVWNMDARAGAVTDARAKGATRADAMEFATHTQEATNRRYDRGRIAATSRVAVLRFGKGETGNEGA